MTRRAPLIVTILLLVARMAPAEMVASLPWETASTNPTSNPTSEPAENSPEKAWEFSLTASTYLISGGKDYVQPTFTADHDWLHLEARYNYEGLDTGSAWVGYNFSVGDEIKLDFTPMVGGVFGHTNGVAPGYEITLAWWKLELYTEGEYVFDVENSSDNFFYTWSEVSIYPLDWLRFGLVIQRTKDYETDFDTQHGLLVGFTYKQLSFTTYVLNPEDDPIVVLAVGVDF
jgi:hypothetical protein